MHKTFAIALISAYASAQWKAAPSPDRGDNDGSSQDNAINNPLTASVASSKEVKTDLFTYMAVEEATNALEFHGDSVIYGPELDQTFTYGWCMENGSRDVQGATKTNWDCQAVHVELYGDGVKDSDGKDLTSNFVGSLDLRFTGDFNEFGFDKIEADLRKPTDAEVDGLLAAAQAEYDAAVKVIATGKKVDVKDLTEDDLKNVAKVPTREEVKEEADSTGIPDGAGGNYKHNWTISNAKSHLNCAQTKDAKKFSCLQPTAQQITDDGEAKAWMQSGVNFHFARNFVTEDLAGFDYKFTKSDEADLTQDDPKTIDTFSFYWGWANRAGWTKDGAAPSKIVQSSKVLKIMPFSSAAYKKLVTDPEAAAKKKAEDEAAKLAEEEKKKAEDKDGAQQITASAAAVLAAAYALSF